MRRLRLAFHVLCGVVLLAAFGAGAALGAAVPARIDLAISPADKLEQGFLIGVTVKTGDTGRAVNEIAVKVYEVINLFGPREMYIGTITTNSQGQGSLTYLPAELGPQEIVVRFGGDDRAGLAEARGTLRATVAAAPYRVEPAPLGTFTAKVPLVVGVLVLGVWATIAYALLGTGWGIASHAAPAISAKKQ